MGDPRLAINEVEQRLDRVSALLASEPMSDAYGESLSVREHMFLAAQLAVQRIATPAMVAACLLHDIGWGMTDADGPHEASGAAWLAPIFGPAVSEPVRLHVEAKRYLVAREPGYFDTLSTASKETLTRQGGSHSDEEAARFERSPWFESAIALRRIDEAAKLAGAATGVFDQFRPMLRQVALAHLLR